MLACSHEEAVGLLERRCQCLADRIAGLIRALPRPPVTALDIGAQDAYVTELVTRRTGVRFVAADPAPEVKPGIGSDIPRVRCRLERLPFASGRFDVVVMNSVFEHVAPDHLDHAAAEVYRVLRPEGALVGQMPNMNYPIESHSWLPFQQFLPKRLGAWYYDHWSPHRVLNPGGINWFRNSAHRVDGALRRAGFRSGRMHPATYPPDVFPPAMRRIYRLINLIPLNYDYSYAK